MVARGLSIYDIAEKVGISSVQAYHDVTIVRQMWVDNSKEDLERIRAEGIYRWEGLFHTAMEGYEASVREGRGDPKFLSAAGTCLKEQQRLQGLAADINLAQTNVYLNGEASTEEVLGAFAPMSAEDYASLTEAGASLTQLPPSAGHSGALERHSQAVEAIHTANEEEPTWGAQEAIQGAHSQEPVQTAGTAHSKGSKPITNPIAASR